MCVRTTTTVRLNSTGQAKPHLQSVKFDALGVHPNSEMAGFKIKLFTARRLGSTENIVIH